MGCYRYYLMTIVENSEMQVLVLMTKRRTKGEGP